MPPEDIDRLLAGLDRPSPRQAEEYLIGGLLRDPAQMSDCVSVLCEADFSDDACQCLWRVLRSLYDSHRPIDLPTVYSETARTGLTGRLGKEGSDVAALAWLWDLDPTGGNVTHNLAAVRDASLRRRIGLTAGQILRMACAADSTPAQHILGEAERMLFALSEVGATGQVVTLAEILQPVLDRIDQRCLLRQQGQPVPGVTAGIRDLDELTGGWQPGELVIVAARPSVGKTAFALALARAAADAGHTPFLASIEQGRLDLGERMLCAESGVEADLVRRGNVSAQTADLLNDAGHRLRNVRLAIDDASTQPVLRIAANARRLKSRGQLGIVFVDYLQLVTPENSELSRREQVGNISWRLKTLARELNVPVVALAQLNREVENRPGGKPRLSDLRDSGNIEQDADVVLLLHRHPEYPASLQLILAKQRNGPVGEVFVDFDRARMRIIGRSNQPSADPFPS